MAKKEVNVDEFFKSTKEEYEKIVAISRKAKAKKYYDSMLDCQMDLDCVNSNDVKLDFDKLLGFDDFNFAHDVCGIARNLNRETGKLGNCFLPRCTKGED